MQWNAEYKVLQCLPHNGRACPAAEAGCHCWHLDAALAAEAEFQTECRINRDADLAEAMEGRTPEEISEQALIQHYVGQGVDLATAARVVYAKGLPPVDEYTPVAESPRPFSLLK